MEYFICIVPVMPLRALPSDRSEMVSQLLFGECSILLEEEEKDWIRVKNQFDGYEGWASGKQLHPVTEEFYHLKTTTYSSDPLTTIRIDHQLMYLPAGSFLKGLKNHKMDWGAIKIDLDGKEPAPVIPGQEHLGEIALKYLNTAYLWGGRSNFGIDCSGLTQSVYRLAGIPLPRDTGQQVQTGREVKITEGLKCGDLAFFKNEADKIIHVGMLLNDRKIIHASGRVRIDYLDEKGILNKQTHSYSHRLAGIRRIL